MTTNADSRNPLFRYEMTADELGALADQECQAWKEAEEQFGPNSEEAFKAVGIYETSLDVLMYGNFKGGNGVLARMTTEDREAYFRQRYPEMFVGETS